MVVVGTTDHTAGHILAALQSIARLLVVGVVEEVAHTLDVVEAAEEEGHHTLADVSLSELQAVECSQVSPGQ